MLPDYFFEVPASSSGRYHPPYALGLGGLIRHTKSAVMIAHELLEQEIYYSHYSSAEQDMMLVALILHDGWKHGPEATAGKYTVAEHPTVCADWIRNAPELKSALPEEQISFIAGCIASHMGMYNTDYKSKKEILPKPKTSAQKFVHQADLLASRRWLNVDFEDDYYAGPKKEAASEDDASVDTALNEVISEIVTICKTLIDSKKVKRTDVYKVVSDNNNGNRNPNSIQNIEVATKIKKALEELNG